MLQHVWVIVISMVTVITVRQLFLFIFTSSLPRGIFWRPWYVALDICTDSQLINKFILKTGVDWSGLRGRQHGSSTSGLYIYIYGGDHFLKCSINGGVFFFVWYSLTQYNRHSLSNKFQVPFAVFHHSFKVFLDENLYLYIIFSISKTYCLDIINVDILSQFLLSIKTLNNRKQLLRYLYLE